MKAEHNPFIPGEIENITKIKSKNDRLDEHFKDECVKWNTKTEPLFKTLMLDLTNPSNARTIINTQADVLTYKQNLNEQIRLYLNKRAKESRNMRMAKQEKMIFYAVGYSIKTNAGEKNILIDGNIAELQRTIDIIDGYIDFLRDTSKNLESFQFSIKNMIQLLTYLGG